jgi:predicted phosphodiesterase
MKIAVMTDVHGNLPALEAALGAIHKEGCDAIYHTGDAIGIGPYPEECLDLLLNTPNILCVMGNHELWFVDGLPQPQPAWMGDGEVAHQQWTHAGIDPKLRLVVAGWPMRLQQQCKGVRMTFVHYGLDASGRGFAPILQQPTTGELDNLFANEEASLIFYGHHHPFSDIQGRARYVNPGSLGCYHLAVARYAVVSVNRRGWTVEHRVVPYEDGELWRAFEQRQTPERAFIYRAFFGGRFDGNRVDRGG